MEILYQDKYFLVINKPAGLIVQGAKERDKSLLFEVKSYLKIREGKKGNVFLGVVHRLDKPVSGALILAKRSKTASKFFDLMQRRHLTKVYLAKVEGFLKKGEGLWKDFLFIRGKNKEALTLFKVFKSSDKESLLLLSPLTGRKHQLRRVLSKRGHPIWGDIKYGSKYDLYRGKAIYLHALFLSFPHPHSQELIEIWAPIPDYFPQKCLDKEDFLEFLYKIKEEKERLKNVSGQNLD